MQGLLWFYQLYRFVRSFIIYIGPSLLFFLLFQFSLSQPLFSLTLIYFYLFECFLILLPLQRTHPTPQNFFHPHFCYCERREPHTTTSYAYLVATEHDLLDGCLGSAINNVSIFYRTSGTSTPTWSTFVPTMSFSTTSMPASKPPSSCHTPHDFLVVSIVLPTIVADSSFYQPFVQAPRRPFTVAFLSTNAGGESEIYQPNRRQRLCSASPLLFPFRRRRQ